jgi:hypothetical protein
MNSTLSEVHKIWSGDSGLEIAAIIDQIGDQPAEGIKRLLKNRDFITAMYTMMTSLHGMRKEVLSTIVQGLLNKDFFQLLPRLEIDGISLKRAILSKLSPDSIAIAIKTAVEASLDKRSTNSSIVYLTGENVRRTELIERLHISSYDSILGHFTDFKVLSKTSASNSLVFTAVLTEIRIQLYCKVFPIGRIQLSNGKYYTHDTSGLEFEQYAYEQLYKLVEYHVTPNILCKGVISKLSGFDHFVEDPDLGRESIEMKRQVFAYNKNYKIEPRELMWTQTGIIMTQPGGQNIGDAIRMLTPEQRKHVMFQLFYTLYVFENIEFSHGDLHAGNIFIVDVPKTTLCYVVEGQVFRFTTTKMVKIYDFDHGTLCKDTSLKVNTTEHILIPKRLNPIRSDTSFLNTELAETNIFNKNLDIIIFCNALSYDFSNMYYGFNMFGEKDRDFDRFFATCFPGFDSNNPISEKTVQETYEHLVTDPVAVEEGTQIYGVRIDSAEEIMHYGVSAEVLDMTWMEYFQALQEDHYGRIVKNFDATLNNHLWIPDSVVIRKIEMLKGNYFRSLHSNIPIDIRREIVYTIDGRIL